MGDHKAAERRKARLADALRENVRRRKTQARKRKILPEQANAELQEGESAATPPKDQS